MAAFLYIEIQGKPISNHSVWFIYLVLFILCVIMGHLRLIITSLTCDVNMLFSFTQPNVTNWAEWTPLPPPKKSRIFKLWVCQTFLLLMYIYIARPGLKWDISLICGLIGLCVICCLFSQYMFCLWLCMFIALTLFLLCFCLSQLPFNCCSTTQIWQILLNLMYSCESVSFLVQLSGSDNQDNEFISWVLTLELRRQSWAFDAGAEACFYNPCNHW